MNKNDLIEYLKQHFETVIINDKENKINYEQIKMNFELIPNSNDEHCFINIANIIVKNHKNQFLYFIYYCQKNSTMIYDAQKKCINILMANNVIKRYQYEPLLKRVKKYINKSNSYLIFFCNNNVEFNENINKHILILNENNIDYYLNQYFDNF